MTGEFRRPGGVSLRTYQRYEYGEREPQFSTSIKLSDYYAVSQEHLAARGRNPNNGLILP